MGWGDEIMASGQARQLQEADPRRRRIAIRDRFNGIRGNEMWANNPRIVGRREPYGGQVIDLVNYPGNRPYIAGRVNDEKWIWRTEGWKCPRGEIYFSKEELQFAEQHAPADLLVIEPNNKPRASPNKDWGRARWQRLADLLRERGIKPWQLGPAGSQRLQGVGFIETPTFRHACAVLSKAKLAILPEGGLHHAAAALGVRTVVIFGGFISPKQTGYDTQINIFTGGEPCGMRIPCRHCAESMAKITPELVLEKAGL